MSAKALSAEVPTDEFSVLEDKVYRTIELYKTAREAKSLAERDMQRLRQQLEEREEEVEQLRREAVALKREREDVRTRIENMLRQIEALAEEAAAD